MKASIFFRKLLAGSLSFFLLSSNLSFLGVIWDWIVDTTHAAYIGYNPATSYIGGDTFNYNGIDIDVTGTGVGNTVNNYFPGCDTKDIAIWSGSSVQVWSACNAGATTSYSGSGQSVIIADTSVNGGPDSGQQSYIGAYYQWHRNEPIVLPSFTGTLALVDSGATFAGHSLFITGSFTDFGGNWATFTGTSLDPAWSNSPCGSGYLMPLSWDWTNAKNILGSDFTHFINSLRLPLAGDRLGDGQYLSGHGKYWAADPNGQDANGIWLQPSWSGNVVIDTRQRGVGSSVRCMLNLSGSGGGWGGSPWPQAITPPITISYANGGQYSSGGIMTVSIKNDRPESLTGILMLGIALPKDFILSSPSFSSFSGVNFSGKSCSGGISIDTTSGYNENIMKCALDSSFDFLSWSTISVELSGVVNPSRIGKYYVNARLSKTLSWGSVGGAVATATVDGNSYWGNTIIKDVTDTVAPAITSVYVQNANQVVVVFDKPINLNFSPSPSIGVTVDNGLQTYGLWDDWNSQDKLFINTDTQSGGVGYTLSLSWVRNFNDVGTGVISAGFTGFIETAPHIVNITPYNFTQGKTDIPVDFFGMNNIFSGAVNLSNIFLGSGVTITGGSYLKIDDNHISFKASISSGATIGSRDISYLSQRIFNGLFIDKPWNTFVDLKANVQPQNNTASARSSYFIDFPISKKLSVGDTIEVKFPIDFDVSQAKFNSGASMNYLGGNVSNAPKFTIVPNATEHILTYTIANGYTLSDNDFITSGVESIVNPAGTGSHFIVEVTTKNSAGQTLDKLQSQPIFIKEAPLGSSAKILTVKMFDTAGSPITGSSISGAVVRLDGPEGHTELIMDQSWQATYTGTLNTYYNLSVDPLLKIKDGYTYTDSQYLSDGKFSTIYLDNNRLVTFTLRDITDASQVVTVAGSIVGLSWKKATLWISTPLGYFERDINGGNILSDPQAFSLQIPKNAGYASIGVRPTLSKDFQATSYTSYTPDWQPPRAQNLDIGTSNITGVDFVVEPANTDFTVTVKTNTDIPVSRAHISVYSPSGDSMGLYGDTDMNGQKTFKVKKGSYTYGAYVDGLPTPVENMINIGAEASYSGVLTIILPATTIEGTVYNNGSPIANASISGYETTKSQYIHTMTDINGKFKLYTGDGTWKIGGWVSSYGPLSEKSVVVSGTSVNNQDFNIDAAGLITVTGNVLLANGDPVAGANIFAESNNGEYMKGGFAFTDENGNYTLNIQTGSYMIHSYHPLYGEIGFTGATITASQSNMDFLVAAPKSVTFSFTGAIPDNAIALSKFEWIIDIFDPVKKTGFSKTIKNQTAYTFDNVPSGVYRTKMSVIGMGEVYNSGSFVVASNLTQQITLASNGRLVSITGTVTQTGTTNPLQDAFIELRETATKQVFWTKTNSGGIFDLRLASGSVFELIAKKPWYEQSRVYTGTANGSNTFTLALMPINNTITIDGTLVGSVSLENAKVFMSLQWVGTTDTGAEMETPNWFGKEVLIGAGGAFSMTEVPAGFGTGKLIIAADGYEMKKNPSFRYANTSVSLGAMVLTPKAMTSPKTTSITPSQGWVINDSSSQFRIILPSAALGDGVQPGSVTTKETTKIPSIPGSEPIGWKAKEIKATDSNGNSITNLNSDATIELSYSGSDIYAMDPDISMDVVSHLQISYYDATSMSWIALPTTVSASSGSFFDTYTGATLLSSVAGYDDIVFTLKATTDHFTLFTALISTVVANSTVVTSTPSTPAPTPSSGGGGGGGSTPVVSLATALTTTFNSISKYLGDTTQSIVLKSGANINTVLSIKRDGKTIALADLLKTSATTLSSVSKNLVSFAVGDVISTSKDGSLEIALDGYSKMQLSPGSSMKIAEAGNGFLSYENMGGNVQYQFDKRDGGKFEYKVKGKTGYATIRGTTLEVSSNSTKDTYKLIEGKIDIYNSILKKTVSLIAGDTYTVYASGKEDLTKMESLKVATTSTNVTPIVAVLAPCGPYKDVDMKSEFCPYITKLNQKGIARTNATYEPNRSISRAELLKMANLSRWTTPIFNKLYTYLDIKTSDWWAPYVSTAKRLGFISATNVNFEPNRPITRAEAMKIIMNFSGVKMGFDAKYSYGDIRSTDWSAPYISTAKKSGFISATQTKFRPNDSISRAEVAKILFNIFFKQ